MTTPGTDLVLDLRSRVGEAGSLSGLDKKLLRWASERKTPDEMSDLLGGGLTSARCAQRVKEILASKDWLSLVEQQAILMNDMVELKNLLFEAVRDEGNLIELRDGRVVYKDPDPRWSANLIRLFKEFRTFINETGAKVEGQAMTLRQGHADIMTRGIEQIFKEFVVEVAAMLERGEPVGETALMLKMEQIIPVGLSVIEEKVEA